MPKPTRESLWRARIDLPDNPYSDSDLECIVQAIEEGANHQLSPGERKRLQKEVKMVARAFILATHQHQGPKPGQIKAALEDLHKAADELLKVVRALDDATVFALLRQNGKFRKAYLAEVKSQSFERSEFRVLSIVSALSAEAKAAIKEVGKPHPPPNESLLDWIIDWDWDPIYRQETPVTMLIIRLAFIFHEVTREEPLCKHRRGKEPYHGNFLPFVRACLSPLESKSREALGKTIQDALPKWRAARDERD